MIPKLTICVATLNRIDCLTLMYESLLKYHERDEFLLYIYDNLSTDGVAEYAQDIADRFVTGEKRLHGDCINILAKMAHTPYILSLDTDVEMHTRCLDIAFEELGDASVVYPTQTCYIDDPIIRGHAYKTHPRIDPSFALFNAADLQEVLQYCSLGSYINEEELTHWDTGGMVLEFFNYKGKKSVVSQRLRDCHTHLGSTTGKQYADLGTSERTVSDDRYKYTQARLAALRNN